MCYSTEVLFSAAWQRPTQGVVSAPDMTLLRLPELQPDLSAIDAAASGVVWHSSVSYYYYDYYYYCNNYYFNYHGLCMLDLAGRRCSSSVPASCG